MEAIKPQRSVVKIVQGKRLLGTGYLAAEHTIVTCWHVVRAAIEELERVNGAGPPICAEFAFSRQSFELVPDRAGWHKPYDVCLLRFANASEQPDAPPLPAVNGDNLDVDSGTTYRVFGFPEHFEDGRWSQVTAIGELPKGLFQFQIKEAPPVEEGFSGAPIWDPFEMAVIGVVTQANSDIDHQTLTVLQCAKFGEHLNLRPSCPYVGLKPFGPDDISIFCGREDAVRKLRATLDDHDATILSGASGSGKSSLVAAGVLPQLRVTSSYVVHFRPLKSPLHQVCAAILEQDVEDVEAHAADLLEGKKSIGDLFEIRDVPEEAKKVLVVDQLEEVYSPTVDEQVRGAFFSRLLEWARLGRARLLLVVRSDFASRLVGIGEGDRVARFELDGPAHRMSVDEARAAILEPAAKVGVEVEEDLDRKILDELGEDRANLCLLQLAMTRLWQSCQGVKLTHARYNAMGGVHKVISDHADQAVQELLSSRFATEEELCRIFVQLVRPGELTRDTRRRATIDEIGIRRWRIVLELASKRLVVTTQTGKVPTVELIHDVLIDRWERLQHWVQDNRDFRSWQEGLRADIGRWVKKGEDEGALLRGALLSEATRHLTDRREELSADDMRFIVLSMDHEAGETVRLRQLNAMLQWSRDGLKKLIKWLGGSLAAALIFGFLAVYFYVQGERQYRDYRSRTDVDVLHRLDRQVQTHELVLDPAAIDEWLRIADDLLEYHGPAERDGQDAESMGEVEELDVLLLRIDDHRDAVEELRRKCREARRKSIELHADPWRKCLEAYESLEAYKGLNFALEPQVGLVPIGTSKRNLLEFVDLGTGSIPVRDENEDLVLTESSGIVLVLVPGSENVVGALETDARAEADELPALGVAVAPFLIGKYEVTQAQWRHITGDNPSSHVGLDEADRAMHPVENVTWNSANRILGEHGMSLPTEVQWELACRAGERHVYLATDSFETLKTSKFVRLQDNGATDSILGREPNGFGLHDMLGNVWEWCRDWHGRYGSASPRASDGMRDQDPSGFRICRGGSYDDRGPQFDLRISNRNSYEPDYRSKFLGVRVVRRLRQ